MAKPSIQIIPIIRGRDAHGAGYFGAPRSGGARTHNGVDFVAVPNASVLAFFPGVVSKLGWVYSDPKKSEFRYVEVTDERGCRARYMYVLPRVEKGDVVSAGTILGKNQKLPYEGITPHIHFEVKRGTEYLDPLKYLSGDA
jgi:murein DD-endopeptidase MepM/ murein hydrolase activator NlpD